MGAPTGPATASQWEAEGRRAADALDGCNAAIVVGDDPDVAAQVALGIGRLQARRRRVAIADLVGELPALQRLVPADAMHGLIDSFTCGVSLGRVGHAIDPARNLLILPSGAGPIDPDEMLRSDRWAPLVSGFRDADALLLIVAPADSQVLRELISTTDGAVVAGPLRVTVPGRTLIRVTGTSEPASGRSVADSALAAIFGGGPPKNRRDPPWFLGGLILLLVLSGTAFWAMQRGPADAAAPPAAVVDPYADSLGRDSFAAAGPLYPVQNPDDSAAAVQYSVLYASLSSTSSANYMLDSMAMAGSMTPTIAPVLLPIDNARWFRLFLGAFARRESADTLLRTLRRRRVLKPSGGEVRRVPFALLLEGNLPREQAVTHVHAWQLKSVPAYTLLQDDGNANVYAGAFETPEQAELLLGTFPTDEPRPAIVYRTGRPF